MQQNPTKETGGIINVHKYLQRNLLVFFFRLVRSFHKNIFFFFVNRRAYLLSMTWTCYLTTTYLKKDNSNVLFLSLIRQIYDRKNLETLDWMHNDSKMTHHLCASMKPNIPIFYANGKKNNTHTHTKCVAVDTIRYYSLCTMCVVWYLK